MKFENRTIDDVLKACLPSASKDSKETIDSLGVRGLQRLRRSADANDDTAEVGSRRFPLWQRLVLLPAMAVVILAVVLGLLWRQDALAIGEGEDGSIYRIGDTVRTMSGLTINLKNGSRVEVKSDSELSFQGDKSEVRINLVRGGVAVLHGEARVQQGLVEKKLVAGEQIATAEPPTPATRDVFDVVSIRSRAVSNNGGARGAAGENSLPSGGSCAGRLQLDPSRFAATNAGLYFLIALAYGLDEPPFNCGLAAKAGVLVGGPEWIQSTGFDIEAVIPAGTSALIPKEAVRGRAGNVVMTNTPGPRLRNMVRAMLEDRFKLKLRRETKETSVYILSAAKDGPKNLQPWKEGEKTSTATGYGDYLGVLNFPPAKHNYGNSYVGYISGGRLSMDFLAGSLATFLNKPVLNRTNIAGNFNFEIFFAPPDPERYARAMAAGAAAGYKAWEGMVPLQSPTMFKALEEELGLKLEPAVAPVEVFTIDRVEKPSDNFEVISVRPSAPLQAGGRGTAEIGGPCGPSPKIDPSRFVAMNTTVYDLVARAYRLGSCSQVDSWGLLAGGPDWIKSERFDIQAAIPAGAFVGTPKFGDPKLLTMLQGLLSERFKLGLYREMKEKPVYVVTVAKGGPKLTPTKEGDEHGIHSWLPLPDSKGQTAWHFDAKGYTVIGFFRSLPDIDRPVVDRTGITGLFNFNLEFAPRHESYYFAPDKPTPVSSTARSLFGVIEEELGLKVEATRAPVEVMVIDRVERPAGN